MLVRSFKQQRIIPLMILLFLSLTLFVPVSTAQNDNVCREDDLPVINFDEPQVGFLDPNLPVTSFCFDAERGTEVTVTLTPITQNLATALVIGTPFVDSDGAFVDEVLLLEESPLTGGDYSGTTSIPADGTYLILVRGAQNVQGTFNLTLELSGGNVLGGTTTDDSEIVIDEAEAPTLDDVIYGQTDLCTVNTVIELNFDEVYENSANSIEPVLYCFEASEGDIVTVNLSMLGDVPMGYSIVDPLYDATPNSLVYSRGFTESPDEPFTGEFFVNRDGRFVLFVVPIVESAGGDFSLSISSTVANVYTCDNEPLATLASREWGVVADDGTELIEINIACTNRIAIATFGAGAVTQYSVTQNDEFLFIFQNRLYTTTSLSQDEWVIQRDDGQEFSLQAQSNPEDCSDEALQRLIRGSWLLQLDANQLLFFDFTCNNTVLIDDQQNPSITGQYDYVDNTITLAIGEQVSVLSNVVVSEGVIQADLDGFPVQLQDVLYEGTEE